VPEPDASDTGKFLQATGPETYDWVDINPLIAAETTAREAADALLMPKAGGTFTGAVKILKADNLALDEPIRSDQGWRILEQTFVETSTPHVEFALPSIYARFRVEWEEAIPAAVAALYMRLAVDGVPTFLTGATDYGTTYTEASFGGVIGDNITGDTVALSGDTSPTHRGAFGRIEFSPAANFHLGNFECGFITTLPALFMRNGCFNINQAARVTHIRLGFVGQNVGFGRFTLLGRG
jgi:hypothetical protein